MVQFLHRCTWVRPISSTVCQTWQNGMQRTGTAYWCSHGRVFDTVRMRRYKQPAEVEVNQDGAPVRFTAWGRTYLVVEVLGPCWDETAAWWTTENLGKQPEELQVRHHRVRAQGVRVAVVELVQRGEEWFVEGVED